MLFSAEQTQDPPFMFVGCHRTSDDQDYRDVLLSTCLALKFYSRNLCDDFRVISRDYGYANAHYDELAFWDRRLGTNQTIDETLYFKASISELLTY